jgi:holo-[acyl-carrier protein] synthase
MTRVGIDAVDVARIEGLCRRYGARFLARLFTPGEIAYALSARGNRRFERLAARFAAKEALVKAAGHAVSYTAIEVVRTASGSPVVRCAAIEGDITASLSHTERLAVACVLIVDDEREATSSSPSATP